MNILQQDTSEISLEQQKEMTTKRSCSSHITPQITSIMHSGDLSMDTLSLKEINV